MGDFFEDLGKRITETAEAVTKRTGEVVEIQKLKSQIRVMERNNERDFQDIGKMVYDKFKQGEIVDTKFIELCGAIEEREESIENYLREIAERKGKDICPNCKNHLEPDMAYCPKCGTKVEEDIFEEEDIVEPEEADAEESAVEDAASEEVAAETEEKTEGE